MTDREKLDLIEKMIENYFAFREMNEMTEAECTLDNISVVLAFQKEKE